MTAAGLDIHTDAAGTLVGRRPGPPGARTLLFGSHQDTIRNGGRYDGMLGIALPILVLEHLKAAQLPFAVEVLAFADEEGVRFPTALMGPRALAGTFDTGSFALGDRDGETLGRALADFGGDPAGVDRLARDPADIVGFFEVHIEQGPVLETEGLPVGIVSGICGIERWTVSLTGEAAHAGTMPMELRRDAFAGIAEIALALETRCRETEGLVGTVGSVTIEPNVVNAVPGGGHFSVELRAPDDRVRAAAAGGLTETIESICTRRGLGFDIARTYAQKGVPCDPSLNEALADSIRQTGIAPFHLMSGATHDASAMFDLCPVAMLFVRCHRGISHHPDEAITVEDAAVAGDVVARLMVQATRLVQSAA